MTTITAKIIADSISPAGKRLTTLQLRYPLIIHAELMTHRMFSRNARSSRAVPIATMIREVEDDPFVPLHWGAAQSGMQAYGELMGDHLLAAQAAWDGAQRLMVGYAKTMAEVGAAKQVVNRLLAPFLHIDTLVSATEWDGFFELRLHHAAEPHMRMLAEAMRAAMDASAPRPVQTGEWHLPYADDPVSYDAASRHQGYSPSTNVYLVKVAVAAMLRRLSAARCARISYAPFDGEASIEAELRRYDLLVGSRPLHASPIEHQATPDTHGPSAPGFIEWSHVQDHRNFVGWRQNRAFVERETREAS